MEPVNLLVVERGADLKQWAAVSQLLGRVLRSASASGIACVARKTKLSTQSCCCAASVRTARVARAFIGASWSSSAAARRSVCASIPTVPLRRPSRLSLTHLRERLRHVD